MSAERGFVTVATGSDVYYKRNPKHALIALPVKKGWAGLIDLMLGFI